MKNTLIIGILAFIVLLVILPKKKEENFTNEGGNLQIGDDFIFDGLDHPLGKNKIHRHHSF